MKASGSSKYDLVSDPSVDNSKKSVRVPKAQYGMPKEAVQASDMPAGPLRKSFKRSVRP